MDASCGEVQSTNFTCKAQVLAKLHPFLAPNAGQSVPAAVSWRKSWTSKQYDKIGNIDSKVWPIWSHWNTSSRGSVGLLPARIASSLAYQPDISDTSTGAALYTNLSIAALAFAACFSRTLIRTHILTLCALSENCSRHKLPKLDVKLVTKILSQVKHDLYESLCSINIHIHKSCNIM